MSQGSRGSGMRRASNGRYVRPRCRAPVSFYAWIMDRHVVGACLGQEGDDERERVSLSMPEVPGLEPV